MEVVCFLDMAARLGHEVNTHHRGIPPTTKTALDERRRLTKVGVALPSFMWMLASPLLTPTSWLNLDF